MKSKWHNLAVVVGIVLGLVLASGFVKSPVSADVPPDVDILHKVKQAGLWEMPVGSELAARSLNPQVRDIGARISAEHHQLNQITDVAAAKMGVTLPVKPTEDQQNWMAQVAAASPENVDRVAINLLRAAHGKVLPLLAQVKVGTRSPIIRDFTTESMIYVSRHIGYLESSGLVEFSALPEPILASSTSVSYINIAGWIIVSAVLIWWLYRTSYPQRTTAPRHRKK
jgi:predicted outer membrane protein